MLVNSIELKPSWRLLIFLLCIHLCAIICIYFLIIPIWVKWILIGLCMVSLQHYLRRDALLLSANAVIKLKRIDDKAWQLWQRNGNSKRVMLLDDLLVNRYVVILNFRISRWRRCSVLIAQDALPADEFRKLRVQLL